MKKIAKIVILVLIIFSCDDRVIEIEQNIDFDFTIEVEEDYLVVGEKYPIQINVSFGKEVKEYSFNMDYTILGGTGKLYKNGLEFSTGVIRKGDQFEIEITQKNNVVLEISLNDKFSHSVTRNLSLNVKDESVLYDYSFNANIDKDSVRYDNELTVSLDIFEFGEEYDDITYSLVFVVDNEIGKLYYNNNELKRGEKIVLPVKTLSLKYQPDPSFDNNGSVKITFQVENNLGLKYQDEVSFRVYGNKKPIIEVLEENYYMDSGKQLESLFPAENFYYLYTKNLELAKAGAKYPFPENKISLKYKEHNIYYDYVLNIEDPDGEVESMVVRLVDKNGNSTTYYSGIPKKDLRIEMGYLRVFERFFEKYISAGVHLDNETNLDYDTNGGIEIIITDSDGEKTAAQYEMIDDFSGNTSTDYDKEAPKLVIDKIECITSLRKEGLTKLYGTSKLKVRFSTMSDNIDKMVKLYLIYGSSWFAMLKSGEREFEIFLLNDKRMHPDPVEEVVNYPFKAGDNPLKIIAYDNNSNFIEINTTFYHPNFD